MLRTNLRLIVWSALGLWAAAATAADPWQGARIMPKSDQVLLRTGQEITGDVYQIEWPANVERIEGQWLFVSDQGAIGVPATSGWVRKDDVLKLAEAQAHYTKFLENADAPWVHWLLGICLQEQNESSVAQQEFLKALGGVPDNDVAVSGAVETNPNMMDAAIHLESVKADSARFAKDVETAANRLRSLGELAKSRGIRRPHAFFLQAEAFNRAYRLKLQEERGNVKGIDTQVARANLEKDGGTADDQTLFASAEACYQTTSTLDPYYAQAGPHVWKGTMGRAELNLSRVAFLNDEVWSLIRAASPSSSSSASSLPPETTTANGSSATTVPIDLNKLNAFVKGLSKPLSGTDSKTRLEAAHAACFCLAAEIQSLNQAIDCFDQAVAQNADIVEAYRDRGLAYLALARCEAVLGRIQDSLNDKIDPGLQDFQNQLARLNPQWAILPSKPDRSLVQGREGFDAALQALQDAKADKAEIAAQKQLITSATQDLAKNYVTAAVKAGVGGKGQRKGPATAKHTDADAKEQEKASAAEQPDVSLPTLRQQLQQLAKDVGDLEKDFNRDDAKAAATINRATAALDDSYTVLNRSRYLQSALRSAQMACGKENYSTADSLQILAEVYADQCNFDRAEFYQKLAVVFASEQERPQLLQTYETYDKMNQLITEKAKAKTPVPSGQGKGGKSSGGGGSGAGSGGGDGSGDGGGGDSP